MNGIAGMRLTAPRSVPGEFIRRELLDAVLQSPQRLIYIQAGAGYGKTSLLSQIARMYKNAVWISLGGENEIFTFVSLLSEAVGRVYEAYSFSSSEFMPFEDKDNFITILANAFLNSLEKLPGSFVMLLDDAHTVKDPGIKELIAYIMKYLPKNVRFFLASREVPWPGLATLRVRGEMLELTQKEMQFTKDEAERFLGFYDGHLYDLAEGWPLALSSFRVLFQNGVSPESISSSGHDTLYEYLLHECLLRLAPEVMDFLQKTACFEKLDAPMLDAVLGIKNARLILDSLVSRNMFTIRTGGANFRYHALFREYLLKGMEDSEKKSLAAKAGVYYFDRQAYSMAARYAISSGSDALLQKTILAAYREYIKSGRFGELRQWFQALGSIDLSCEMLVAKGALLSSVGDFSHAKACLDSVLLQLKRADKDLYIEATLHKARVLRNFVSFEESNRLLDELLSDVAAFPLDVVYSVAIEKLYNLCWNSQIREAFELADHMIEECARAGVLQVRAWFERYLTVIHFYAGDMKKTVYFYEKSLAIPEDEKQHLNMHCIDIYAAKAYQYLGDEGKAVSLMAVELQRIRSAGRYEELWAAYLLTAEMYCESALTDKLNGGNRSYETAIRYFTLADEYAPLYRTTEFQKLYAKLLRLANIFYFSEDRDAAVHEDILANLDKTTDYFKNTILGKLFGHYTYLGDLRNAVKYAELSTEIGQRSGAMLIPAFAYGLLALNAIMNQEYQQAVTHTRRCLQLCSQNGIYSYFKMKNRYGIVLQFAIDNDIEVDFARRMMNLAGLAEKKIYIETFGGFSVFSCKSKKEPVKMRSRKERELLAFLLDAGREGATKEQIYEAIWFDSESGNIKKLIDVNITHIRTDLASLGISISVVNHKKHYRLCRDEITTDIDLFEAACSAFEQRPSIDAAQKILSLYKGEYLSDFEALWAMPKRIKYRRIYEQVLKYGMCAATE